ncbi:MAG: sensor histidine kinase [Acidobacteriota bacterium]
MKLGLLKDLLFTLGGALVALLLLQYLHGQWQPSWALGCGVVAGIFVRRAVAPSYASFPDFLRRPLDLSVVLLGTLLAAWGTLAAPRYGGIPYLLSVWRQAVALPVVAAVLGLAVAAAVYTHGRMRREVEAHRTREAAMRETALRAQLKALQAQINPHFLFNAFNALAELVHDEADLAEELIGDLAHLLRYSLYSSASGTVSLAQELEAVERYLRIEKARLGERLKVERSVDPTFIDTPIPGLILQPLLENAVRYAVAPRAEGGTVQIEVSGEDGFLRIAVEDDGPGMPEGVGQQLLSLSSGVGEKGLEGAATGTAGAGGGLVNVYRRLLLSYRGAARLSLREADGGGAHVEIRVPR